MEKITFMECVKIAGERMNVLNLSADIQFAFEDKHYELMEIAAELYRHLNKDKEINFPTNPI